jgi:hypothetical protein
LIGAADEFVAAERSHQDQQRAAWQMKIRKQGIDSMELKTGSDE